MEPEATKIMAETLEKNAIDKSEYPQTTELENRCVNMIADLWHAPDDEKFLGTSTVGSSEACMLGGMAMKFRWRNNAIKQGLDVKAKKPNLVISSGYQVCWEKFCVYWDIEMRLVPLEDVYKRQGMSIAITASIGVPINSGVKIRFQITIVIVIARAPKSSPTTAPFRVRCFL